MAVNGAGQIHLEIDGVAVSVPEGANVAAAVARATPAFRRGTQGGIRGPLCGMGVCFECRVRIDACDHQRACMVPARAGMRVQTLA
jgi:sarcosine oxidase subunit alpha